MEQITSFDGQYRFLSNFAYSPIIGPRDLPCKTVEHAFQASKAVLYLDAQRIAEAHTPGHAKKLGRTVTLRPDWDEVKLGFMRTYLDRKFVNENLAWLLLETGDAELIEGNTWGDTYWGVSHGVGENHLGKLLMQVREDLRS